MSTQPFHRAPSSLALLLVAIVLGAAGSSCTRSHQAAVGAAELPPPSVPEPSSTTSSVTTIAAVPRDPRLIPVDEGTTLVATPKGEVPGFDGPGGTEVRKVTNLYYDRPTSLPVIDQVPDWVRVRLAPKPNGSTIWLRATDVDIGSTPWKIVINKSTARIQLYKFGELIVDAGVGIGTDRTPTATGEFFMTFMQRPTSASYGPWVMVTSGHSEVIQVWEGFPDGILAIHGPVGSESLIGTAGARISNGCIRMLPEDQKKLSEVTPGSPIWVID